MKSKKVVVFISLVLAMNVVQQQAAQAAEPAAIKAAFTQLVKNNNLANPAVIVVDESTGEVVFEKNSLVARKPASVIKLITGAAAYTYLSPSDSYTTSLWMGIDTKTVVVHVS